MKKILVILLSVLFGFQAKASKYILFDDGHTKYDIVLSIDASQSEIFAAKDLQSYLKQISGADFDIVRPGQGKRNRRIIIGYNNDLSLLRPEIQRPDPEDQGFSYISINGDIIIYGGSIRGTMYGVYSFLEREFGCQWFTKDFSLIPECKSWHFDRLEHTERPYIQDRFVYFTSGWDVLWSAHNRNNYIAPPDSSGNAWSEPIIHGFNMGHSFAHLVPQAKYWSTHPEYYSEIEGKRVNGEYFQLCLSNPDVLKICIEGTRRNMEKYNYSIIDVSQNDSAPYCHCERCRAMIDSLGNPSDLLLWFVNQVADTLKDEYPDRYIGTFSYMWSVPCPKTIRPRDNVVVRFCTYDYCIAHPLGCCEYNKEQLQNMRDWSKIAKNLYIWNYMASFRQYNVPFPFIRNLVPDIKLFKELNAISVLEEGEYQGAGGNFQDLKSWLVAKLLWNPDLNVNELLDIFFAGYYREAAGPMREYFDFTQTLADKGIHDFCYPKHYESDLYDDAFIRKSLELASTAESSCTDSLTLAHVLVTTLQAHYLHARFHPSEGLSDGTYEHICDVVNNYGIKYLSEWGDVVNLYQLEYMMKYDAGIINE